MLSRLWLVVRALALAVVGMAAGAVLSFVLDVVANGPEPVPDVFVTAPVEAPPAPWTAPSTAVSIVPGPDVDVVPVVVRPFVPAAAVVQPPATFDPPAQPAELDYRAGRIMEPLVNDGHERERAYARCVAGIENDEQQVAYCDEHYGPDSGYDPDPYD